MRTTVSKRSRFFQRNYIPKCGSNS